jgi:hypothetical protein
MDIILTSGLWLDGSSWEKFVRVLEQAGRCRRVPASGCHGP